MRLIDADELGVGRCNRDLLPADYCAGWNGVVSLVECAPTVDAVPVVRCKDCVYFTKKLIVGDWCENPDGLPSPQPDGFCSYGERKENKNV